MGGWVNMLVKNIEISKIITYIGNDYARCLYLYIDLCVYGYDNPNITTYTDISENGDILAVVLIYYTGMHIYSRDYQYCSYSIKDIINKYRPTMICGIDTIIVQLENMLDSYIATYGKVGMIGKLNNYEKDEVTVLKEKHLCKVADLLIKDEGLGGHYESQLLAKQLVERYKSSMGRHYAILSDFGEIISHAATFAEYKNIAVTSAVITSPRYRRKGYANKVLSKLCDNLLNEGKEVYSYYYTQPAASMHYKIGFEDISGWGKLTLKTDKENEYVCKP
jgi:GNAT superfamily N-acetyltransferase